MILYVLSGLSPILSTKPKTKSNEATAQHRIQESFMKGANIIIVDDEHALANMMHDFLSMEGALVKTFYNPLAAMEAFSKVPDQIDLVITDETMPHLSGMELAKKMLALNPNLPVILCTGYSKNATADTAASIGIEAFFNKPVNMVELVSKIKELLPC